jgi:hypothetical protein
MKMMDAKSTKRIEPEVTVDHVFHPDNPVNPVQKFLVAAAFRLRSITWLLPALSVVCIANGMGPHLFYRSNSFNAKDAKVREGNQEQATGENGKPSRRRPTMVQQAISRCQFQLSFAYLRVLCVEKI